MPDQTQHVACGVSGLEVATAAAMVNLLGAAGDLVEPQADATQQALHDALQGGDPCGSALGLEGDALTLATQAVTGTQRAIQTHSFGIVELTDLNPLWALLGSELAAHHPVILYAENHPDLAHAGPAHAVTVIGLAASQENGGWLFVQDSSPAAPPETIHAIAAETLSGNVTVVTVQ